MLTGRRALRLAGAVPLVAGLCVLPGPAAGGPAAAHWVASWTASPTDAVTPVDAAGLPVPIALVNQTVRMVVTPHFGGTVLRIHLSNRFGIAATRFGQVSVGRAAPGSVVGLTTVLFNGRRQVSVPRGADVVSDPVRLAFSAFTPLAISMYLPGVQAFPTKHWNANATGRYSLPLSGDLAGRAADSAFPLRTQAWLYVDGIDVRAPAGAASIVAFGDSITDGFVAANAFSQPVSRAVADKNGRYPDDLQRRLIAAHVPLSVVNAGIGSNRLVTSGEPLMMGQSGLRRFESDALSVPGVRGVLLQEGINDFGLPPASTTPAQLIAGYEQAIAMAHAAGVRIWLGTLLPASNAFFDGTMTAPRSERYREQTNAWIRSQRLADGVVDFDAALRDPSNPRVLNPLLSGPDHLHPDLRGYQAMARAVSLALLRTALDR